MTDTLVVAKYTMSKAEFEANLAKWVNNHCTIAREKLVRSYWGAAKWISARYSRLYGASFTDVFSAALLGLTKGFDNYARKRGGKLNTFLFNQMKWTIIREVPRVQYRIKLPTHIPPKIRRGIDELGLQHPLKSHDMLKLAEHLGLEPEYVEAIYHAMKAREVSYETPIHKASLGLDAVMEDKLEAEWPSPEDFANRVSMKKLLSALLMTLTPREERVIRMRYGFNCDEHTGESIGYQFNVGRERIFQIEAKALRKLKHPSRLIKLRGRMNDKDFPEKYDTDAFELMFGKMPYQ